MNIVVSIPIMMISSIFVALSMGPMMSFGDCERTRGSAEQVQLRADIVKLIELQPNERASYLQCKPRGLLARSQTVFLVTIIKHDHKPHFPRFLTVIDDGSTLRKMDMMPGPGSFLPLLAIVFAVPAAFAFFESNGRRTPGKMVAGLAVKSVDGEIPSMRQTLKREYWKFLPDMLAVLVATATILVYRDTLLSYVEDAIADVDLSKFFKFFAMASTIHIATLMWWLLPFLFWRGQTWHDRLAGTKVVLVERS